MTLFQPKFGPRQIGALCVGLLLVVTGCSSSEDSGKAGGAAGDAPASAAPAAAGEDFGPNGPWVQDLWVFESVRAVNAAGEEVDLTDEILSGLGTPSRSVELPEGATFHVHDALTGTVTTGGTPRGDVDVIAGVLEYDGSRGLAALGTPAPDAVRPIGMDDSVDLDVTFLGERLLPGDPMVVDFLLLQARPAAEEGAATGLDLLISRLAAGEVHHLAEESGEDAEPIAFQSVMGIAVPGSTRMSAPGKGPISGPMMKGLNGLMCTALPIRCIRKYFKKMSKGVESSMELLECNLLPCGDPPPETVPPGLCVKGVKCDTPKVRADPHVTSFDGHYLSMQGVGEYVVTRTDEFEIQMRTKPVNTYSRFASGVAMIAIRSGKDTVQVSTNDSESVAVWVNGTLLPNGAGDSLRDETQHGELTILRVADDVQVTTAQGTAIQVYRSFGWLDLGISLAANHGDVVGLLGDADGNPDNDWRARDGSVLPPETTGRSQYTEFSDSWRVSQAESVLRYEADETTETFTDLTFPDQVMTLDDLDPALRARAAAICQMAGVTDEPLLGQCTLDYALSGELGFVQSAQSVIRAEVAADQAGQSSSGQSGSGSTVADAWQTTASNAVQAERFPFRHTCPAGGSLHSVWGGNNGVYTADSSICTSAVHAGLITVAAGGSVQVTRTPGLDDYGKGSTRNGVTARDWEQAWSGSFTLAP